MRHEFGTDFITGLNVATAPHKIDAAELTVAENCWVDEEGVLRVAPGPTTLYTNYDNIVAMAAGRMGGADHVVWLDGTTLYDNGVNVGTLATTNPVIRDFDDKFFILGADDGKNYIWDGNHLRETGAPNFVSEAYDEYGVTKTANASPFTITAITQAGNARVTVSAPHGQAVGRSVYITGVVGMTEINDRAYTILAVDTNWVEIDVDSSAFTAYSSGGSAYFGSCGLTGTYKFWVTCIVELADGRVIEGNPYGLGDNDQIGWAASLGAKEYTLSPTDSVQLTTYLAVQQSGSFGSFGITGTYGTDYKPGVRIYRTKNGGTDFYLEKEIKYPDVSSSYYVRTRDSELGAVFTPGLYDRGGHPTSSLMSLASQRLWMNDSDNRGYLWFTSLDGVEYVPALNYLTFPDRITAIGSAGDVVVVFSGDRMWRVSILGGVPDVDEIKTPVGTTYGNALALTDLGLLFLREDGLWATDGASPPQIVTRRAFASLTSPAAVAAYGDTLIVCGSDRAYTMRRRDGGTYWHEHGATYLMVDASNGTFYAADANSIYTLFTGAKAAAVMESPDLTIRAELSARTVVLDVSGDDSPSVLVNGNRYSDYDGHPDTGTGRRLVRLPIPRLQNHVFRVRVEFSGDCAIYGYWLEAES